MLKLLKQINIWTFGAISVVFTFIPEALFGKLILFSKAPAEVNIICIRVLTFVSIFLLSTIIYSIYIHKRKVITIKGTNYSIQVEYGDLFEMSSCKKVINFDECFTTSVGDEPCQIKPDSICGQYLQSNPLLNINKIMEDNNIHAAKGKSKYQNKKKYDSGIIIPNNDYLLMSFAKLDKDGLGIFFSRDEFIDCLNTLWKELDKYYGNKDVCIPILGSGRTRMDGSASTSLSQQELLDIIICSYKLSPHKIKLPYKLHIMCKKSDGFSLNKIGTFL